MARNKYHNSKHLLQTVLWILLWKTATMTLFHFFFLFFFLVGITEFGWILIKMLCFSFPRKISKSSSASLIKLLFDYPNAAPTFRKIFLFEETFRYLLRIQLQTSFSETLRLKTTASIVLKRRHFIERNLAVSGCSYSFIP